MSRVGEGAVVRTVHTYRTAVVAMLIAAVGVALLYFSGFPALGRDQRRVYDLRHACVSTWLNGGIPPAQVAEWAGHSVAVLLKVYAKCIDGQDQIAKRRIEDALRETSDGQATGTDYGGR